MQSYAKYDLLKFGNCTSSIILTDGTCETHSPIRLLSKSTLRDQLLSVMIASYFKLDTP